MNCRDRRGLLSDVITALKSFPLEITTAAVTTTADGYVYDVFQVCTSQAHPSVTPVSPQHVSIMLLGTGCSQGWHGMLQPA